MWPLYGLPYHERGNQAMHGEVAHYIILRLPNQNLKELQRVMVRSASGSNLAPIGFAMYKLTLGNKTFEMT